MAKDIASDEQIPAHFLAKLLQQLARKGLLKSQKGPSGGFCLRLKAKDVRLIDIVDAVDGLDHYAKCIVGFPECNDQAGCPMHNSWIALHSRIMDYLRRNTVGSLVRQMEARNQAAGRKPRLKRLKLARESKRALQPSI